MSNVETQEDALGILIAWANDQSNWLRMAVREVLACRTSLEAEPLQRIYERFLVDSGLAMSGGEIADVPAISVPSIDQGGASQLRLKKILKVEGVNRLASNQEIAFNDKLTVLYGENATGKTGYVRILKRLAKVRSAVPVLGDASATSTRPMSAKLEYKLGPTQEEFEWHNEEGVGPFDRMSIFDSPAVSLHVDESLPYVYTPRDLDLYRLTTDTITAVRQKLSESIESKSPPANPFSTFFERDTPVYSVLQSLGAATDLQELIAMANVTTEEESDLAELKQNEAALRPEMIASRVKLVKAELDDYHRLKNCLKAISESELTKYASRLKSLEEAKRDFQVTTQEAFAGVEIPGLLGEAWSSFIRAGENYIQSLDEDDYPADDVQCVYCQQPLDKAALELLGKYRNYCNDTLSQAVTRSREALLVTPAKIRAADPEGVLERISGRIAMIENADDIPEFLADSVVLLSQVLGSIKSMDDEQEIDANTLIAGERALTQQLQVAIDKLEAHLVGLTSEKEERERLHAATRQRLRALEARLKLKSLLPDVAEFVKDSKWVQKANQISKSFANISRTLTIAASRASNDLMNRAFEEKFREECRALRAPNVDLNFPGSRGQATRNKVLYQGHKLSEILSEGEQKVIAISDFLAEAAIGSRNGPVVFDDPTNSLDHRRLKEIASRVVSLANTCQTIVFTHDIWLATELLSRKTDLGANGCTFYEIRETEDAKGAVVTSSHPRWDTEAQLRGEVNELIEGAHNQSGSIQSALIDSAYDKFRAWCEVVVEQKLLAQVCQRYQPNLQMGNVTQIKPNKLQAAFDVIHPLWEKSNRYITSHSQPLLTLGVRPQLSELEADWEAVQQALNNYRAP